uniref:Uncharacterized protein n=1 Tax=uncultured marine virus TaxID=186617 RepID=A0A0F7L1T4_9VIRU|nr:hypothetical protein [uncultured marine virus]
MLSRPVLLVLNHQRPIFPFITPTFHLRVSLKEKPWKSLKKQHRLLIRPRYV